MSSLCRVLANFIVGLFNLYEDLFFTYLEINPLGRLFVFVFFLSFSHAKIPSNTAWRVTGGFSEAMYFLLLLSYVLTSNHDGVYTLF